MYFDELKIGMTVAYNQSGLLVLTDVTEAIVKCKPKKEQ